MAQGDDPSLERAAALYRGALLEGCTEEWAFQERQVRERAYLEALETLAARALARGEIAAAERHLRRAVSADPLLESAQRALMQALVAEGNYAAAVLAYRELRLTLHREINVEPDPETTALFQQFRAEAQQRARLRAATVRERTVGGGRRPEQPTAAVCGAASRPAGLPPPAELEATAAQELPMFALQRALAGGPMVGRTVELGALQRQIEAAAQGCGGTLFLAGEPGIGKTRLTAEAGEYARQRGFRVLIGRCDEAGAAPYQPFGEAVREYLDSASMEQAEETLPPPVACELVRLVPRLAETVKDVPQVAGAAGAAARQALVEAMGEFYAFLTARQGPVLLFLDDLHWADEGTLAVLHHLARRAKGLPLLIVGTYRDLPPDLQPPLEQTLAALNRERLAERIPLRRLPEAGVGEIVAALRRSLTSGRVRGHALSGDGRQSILRRGGAQAPSGGGSDPPRRMARGTCGGSTPLPGRAEPRAGRSSRSNEFRCRPASRWRSAGGWNGSEPRAGRR